MVHKRVRSFLQHKTHLHGHTGVNRGTGGAEKRLNVAPRCRRFRDIILDGVEYAYKIWENIKNEKYPVEVTSLWFSRM